MEKTVVELFAGVGGFHLGLTQASDFNIIWANQWEPGKKVQHAFDCYKHHFGKTTVCVNEDIAKVKSTIPPHTLLVGGFPCQDYSVASTGAKGIEGKKGVLWWEINDILNDKKPPFVLLENVDRLLKSPSNQRGRDFGVMLSCFNNAGYSVEWRVLNAAEYGFAQRRRRVFIFAYRNDTRYSQELRDCEPIQILRDRGVFAEAFPIKPECNYYETNLDYKDLVDVSDNFVFQFGNSGFMKNGHIISAKVIPIFKTETPLMSIMERNVDEKYYLGENLDKWEYLKGPKSIPRVSKTGHEYIFSEGQIAFPDPINKSARTMLTSESSLNRSTHVVEDLDSGKKRLLTPVECERLNGFEDNWTNTGMPHKFRYFCMGNALVVDIVKILGEKISSIIERE